MNRQKRLHQILDSSLRAFARDGYENTSVCGLVKEAKVSRGTFYLYFNSKKEIFDALIDRFMGEVLHYVSLFDAVHLANSEAFGRNIATCLEKYRVLARILMLHSSQIEKSHNTKVDAYIKQCYKILQYNIEDSTRNGVFRQVDGAMMARSLVGTLKEFINEWSDDNEAFDFSSRVVNYFSFLKATLMLKPTLHGVADVTDVAEQKTYREIESTKSNLYSS